MPWWKLTISTFPHLPLLRFLSSLWEESVLAVSSPFPSILRQPLGAASHPLWKLVFSETAAQPHPKPCASLSGWTLGSRDEAKQVHLWEFFLFFTSGWRVLHSTFQSQTPKCRFHGHLPSVLSSHFLVTFTVWWSWTFAVWWSWDTDC